MKSQILVPFLAAVSAIASVDRPTAPAPAGPTHEVDPVHSSAVFRVKHAGAAWFYGRFDKIEGELLLDPTAPDDARCTIKIAADSVHTGAERRDKHLCSPDFFDARQFPTITFTGREFTADGEHAYQVVGELELRGKKKPLTVRVEHTGSGEFRGQKRDGFEAVFSIKRSEFGVKYGLDGGVLGDEVKVMVGLEMVRR